MIYIALAFVVAGNGVFLTAVIARGTGRITDHTLIGWCAVSNAAHLAASVLVHYTLLSAILTPALVWTVWLWWHGGGGDNTKRRLREWGQKFQGVRRTAPVTT